MKQLGLITLLILVLFDGYSQHTARPKIGLALSGGGAKGISHVGVIKVLEQAGIQVDFVTGTSIGSIIGGMYAVGYSIDSIEKLVRSEDWGLMLSNSPNLDQIVIEEKSEFGKYILEMPVVNWRLKLPKGLIEGQNLSVELSRMFSVAYDKKRFNDFYRPYRCIATDITNGEVVILDSGNLAEAVRGSMAIPSVFTPVKYQNRLLVDGGIVHNFPVSDLKEMGADIIIGVSLSQGYMKESQLVSVFDILNQALFMVDNEDYKRQRDLCNYLIEPNMDGYGASSFFDADSLIKRGVDAAHAQFDVFKKLADSLDAKFGKRTDTLAPKLIDSVNISTIFLEGIKYVDPSLVKGKMALPRNELISLNEVSAGIARIYGTRYFNKISYELIPAGQQAQLRLKAVENPNTYFKFAFNQNTYNGSALILNFTTRNTLGKRSRLLATVNLSKNFRFKSEYFRYFGPKQNFGIGAGFYYDQNNYPLYENFVKVTQYVQTYKAVDVHLQVSSRSIRSYGIGLKKEYISATPDFFGSAVVYEGMQDHWNAYVYLTSNTADKVYYPTKGTRTSAEFSYLYATRYDFDYVYALPGGEKGYTSVPDDSIRTFALSRYFQFKFHTVKHKSLSPNWATIFGATAQFTLNADLRTLRSAATTPTNVLFNTYVIGGMVQQFRNQTPFVGVNEYQLNTNNIMALMVGLRYQVVRNLFLIARINGGNYVTSFQEYYTSEALLNHNHYVTGAGLTISYDSILGPLEFTMMRSLQLNVFSTYVNLGYNF